MNATFCEALLAVLLGHPDAAGGATDGAAGSTTTAAPRGAPCEPIVLDVLLERAFEFFLMQKEKRQEVARRRLAALNGRTEEELWRAVLHALSRHRFESLSNKLLVQLEAAGGGGGGRRRGGVGKGVEAMCCALRGLHVPSGAGGADADTTGAGVKEAYSFSTRSGTECSSRSSTARSTPPSATPSAPRCSATPSAKPPSNPPTPPP